MSTREKIYELRLELEEAERQYLEGHSWHYGCDTVDSIWRWSKRLPDGRTIIVDTAAAIRIEGELREE